MDEVTFRARPPLPACPHCSGLARPNVLMFGDFRWLEGRTAAQYHRLQMWLDQIRPDRLAIVECGAGTAVPTVRHLCERLPGTLIRINPREAQVPSGGIALAQSALEALVAIERDRSNRPKSG